MPLLSKPSFGPPTALIYITIGALLDVWTAVWYFWFARDQEGNISQRTWFWLSGLFLTGLTLMLIGFYLGRIGRAARKSETPPPELQSAEAAIQQTAAATGQPAGTMPAMMAPAGTVPVTVTTMPVAPPAPAAPPAQPAPPPYVPGTTRR